MNREILVDNLFTFLPVLYKKFFKGFQVGDLSKQQLELMFCLGMESDKPMTYYGSKLMISKPNLTVLADKLIEDAYITREYLPSDRRVVILKLTEKGEKYLKEQTDKFKAAMVKRLEAFDDKDISRLNDLMVESRTIINKLDEIE